MYRYERLLVGLSLEKQDGSSIRYAAMISKLAQSEKITFLHVASTPDTVSYTHLTLPTILLV